MLVIGLSLSSRVFSCSIFIIFPFLSGHFPCWNHPYPVIGNLDMNHKKHVPAVIHADNGIPCFVISACIQHFQKGVKEGMGSLLEADTVVVLVNPVLAKNTGKPPQTDRGFPCLGGKCTWDAYSILTRLNVRGGSLLSEWRLWRALKNINDNLCILSWYIVVAGLQNVLNTALVARPRVGMSLHSQSDNHTIIASKWCENVWSNQW